MQICSYAITHPADTSPGILPQDLLVIGGGGGDALLQQPHLSLSGHKWPVLHDQPISLSGGGLGGADRC